MPDKTKNKYNYVTCFSVEKDITSGLSFKTLDMWLTKLLIGDIRNISRLELPSFCNTKFIHRTVYLCIIEQKLIQGLETGRWDALSVLGLKDGCVVVRLYT